MKLTYMKQMGVCWLTSLLWVVLVGQWSWTGYSFCLAGLFFVLPSLAFPLRVSLLCNLFTALVLGSQTREAFLLYAVLSVALTFLLYSLRRHFHRDNERHGVLAALLLNALFLIGILAADLFVYGVFDRAQWGPAIRFFWVSQALLLLCAKSFIRLQRWLFQSWAGVRLSELPPV